MERRNVLTVVGSVGKYEARVSVDLDAVVAIWADPADPQRTVLRFANGGTLSVAMPADDVAYRWRRRE